jgi:tRNA(Arg) A34 adenosine deaminase TadA
VEEVEMMKSLIAYTRERALENRTFTGAFIVRDGEVIGKDITSVEPDRNPLAHAELKALQGAITSYGPTLKGCHLYTTQQPCPMCASAIVWSGVAKVVYGVPSSAQWKTFDHVHKFFADSGTECVGPVLGRECREVDEYLIANGI